MTDWKDDEVAYRVAALGGRGGRGAEPAGEEGDPAGHARDLPQGELNH